MFVMTNKIVCLKYEILGGFRAFLSSINKIYIDIYIILRLAYEANVVKAQVDFFRTNFI